MDFMQSWYLYSQVPISLILLNFSLGGGYWHIVWIIIKATETKGVVKVVIFFTGLSEACCKIDKGSSTLAYLMF